MIPYNISPRVNGINGYGLGAPDTIETVVLAPDTLGSVTVPDTLPSGALGGIGAIIPSIILANNATAHNKYLAIFNYGVNAPADVWVSNNQTAELPTGAGSFAASTSQLNPQAWNVKSGDVLSFISPVGQTATISVSFYYLSQ